MRQPDPNLDPAAARADWSTKAKDPVTTYACKLVTPLYGGGVRAGEVDLDLPIRASAIRGQLRFWWRLVRRAADPRISQTDLFQEECAVFGGIASSGPTASLVSVRISDWDVPKCEPAHHYRPNPNRPGELKALPEVAPWASGYALFSAQGKRSDDKRTVAEQPKALALPELGFRLVVRIDDRLSDAQRRDLDTALRWWASFGGLGARTRRGLGAVLIADLSPVAEAEVAAAKGQLRLLPQAASATEAWKRAVDLLRQFRQGVGVGRNEGTEPNRPGRSRWPEADTLRALSGHALPEHKMRQVPGDYFPRAAFGLPIVFHFKDAPPKTVHSHNRPSFDPDDHVLEPADLSEDQRRDRLASPLILRPYWDGAHWRPAALLLPGWRDAISHPLKFKDQPYTPTAWPANGAARAALAALAADVPPMKGRADDALSAFMDFFAKGGR